MSETAPSKPTLWTGRVLSALPSLMLVMSAGMKLSANPMLVEDFQKKGWPAGSLTKLGVLEIACLLIYLVPQTAMLGAILLTGYLGGAIATHVHAGEGFVAPLVLGVMVWAGLFLRDPRLKALLPLRK